MAGQTGGRAALALLLLASVQGFSPSSLLPRAGRAAARLHGPAGRAPLVGLRMDAVDERQEAGAFAEIGAGGKKKDASKAENTLVCLGLSIHTSSVELREKLAVQEVDWAAVGVEISKLPHVTEAAVLSTCNRFEIYISVDDKMAGVREVREFLHRRSSVPSSELKDHLFVLTDRACVWHALRVSGGLDSLVVGEGQILSQMKRCYEISSGEGGGAGKLLTRMFVTAVTAGKRVRSETGISKGGVSISSAAVELVEKQCVGDIGLEMDQLDVAIIGAGKMGRLLVQHLTPRNVRKITLVNRGKERAQEIMDDFPQSPLKYAPLNDMLGAVENHHVTFACTGATEPILVAKDLERVIVRPTMLVDISVPRNVDDAGANAIDDCCAYNVDDLKAVVKANQAKRKKLMVEAEEVLNEELVAFEAWQQSLGTVPMITMLQTRAERIRAKELAKVDSKLGGLSVTEKETVDRITKGIVNKLLHGPMTQLRRVNHEEDRAHTVRKVAQMFNLEDEDEA
eukprot:CAMPEP_0173420316 /NCGR_PEP_ID=MMETSP1357-20121228/1855_1 /TAXON_ID=77926 /ORGANISM="Hemiselmis rufescens, Strain PCC563" /LENGTH=511 /DNA_ID=CAMNT_0014383095 /DNA_START=18 /DNA_END=1556 /DNA_ORIENTATION=-